MVFSWFYSFFPAPALAVALALVQPLLCTSVTPSLYGLSPKSSGVLWIRPWPSPVWSCQMWGPQFCFHQSLHGSLQLGGLCEQGIWSWAGWLSCLHTPDLRWAIINQMESSCAFWDRALHQLWGHGSRFVVAESRSGDLWSSLSSVLKELPSPWCDISGADLVMKP